MIYTSDSPKVAFASAFAYNCWPSKLEYDTSRGVFALIYNANDDHIGTVTSTVQFRTFNSETEQWSSPVQISTIPGGYVESNGLIIMPNGDYVAPVACRNGNGLGSVANGRIYKSSDGGATWSFELMQEAGFGVVSPNTISHCTLLGDFVWMMYTSATGTTQLYKLDSTATNYAVWTKAQVIDRTAVGNPSFANEGRFFSAAGKLLCIARRNVDGTYTTPMRPMFTSSSDAGATWSAWAYCAPKVTEMTNGNMCYLTNDDGTFDLVFSSRLNTRPNGRGHIYLTSNVSASDVSNGNIGRPNVLALGSPTRDFGYPGAAQFPDRSKRLIVWYDRDPADNLVKIWQIIQRSVVDVRNAAYVPGGHCYLVGTGTRTG